MDKFKIPPAMFADMTYPQLVAIFSHGQGHKLRAEIDLARQVLGDLKAGRLKWEDSPGG